MASPTKAGDGAREKRTKKDKIVDELRSLIASGELARGSRIQQDDLAELFQTSITPVREAMRQLEAEGLLVSEPHRGVRVAFADLEQVKGIYIARRLVESHAAQRAALRVSRHDLTRAKSLTDEMEQARLVGDGPELLETNRAFHFLFYDRCGIPSLSALIGTLWLAFPWDALQVIEGRGGQSVIEHRRMIDAVEAADEAAVGEAFATHIRSSYLALARYLTGEDVDDPFDVDVD